MDQDEIDAFEERLEEHGELHVEYEENDGLGEMEVRLGQYKPNHVSADGVFTLMSYGEPHDFMWSRVVNWYQPQSIWEDG